MFLNEYGTYSTVKEMLSPYQIREAYWTGKRFTSLESLTFLTLNLAKAYKFHQQILFQSCVLICPWGM